jgi:ssDNA-binding replication factor A large subunit
VSKVKVKIKDIKARMRDLEVTAEVTKKWETQRSLWRPHALAMLADGTGEIRLNLWRGQIEQVEVGDVVHLKSAFARRYRGAVLELSTWEEDIRIERDRRKALGKRPRPERAQSPIEAGESRKTRPWEFP